MRPSRTGDHWFGRTSIAVAWLVLAVAVIHPPDGLGLPICWVQATTGAPCPGCGLTRSLSCTIRGMFEAAWSYHPFGVLFAGVFLTIAAVSLLPRSTRDRLMTRIARHRTWANGVYVIFVASFLAFGLVRAVIHFTR